MPFTDQIIKYINLSLKAGSLNKRIFQPGKMFGLTQVISRTQGTVTQVLPAVVVPGNPIILMSPDSRLAFQCYHKVVTNNYSYEKASFGDSYIEKCTTDITMVVFNNNKLTGMDNSCLESQVVFGLPQRVNETLLAALKIGSCLITPLSSNMDAIQVFKSEYPQYDNFLTDELSIFSVKYRIEMKYSHACVQQCLSVTDGLNPVLLETGAPILLE